MVFDIESKLFSIGTIIISYETISLMSIEVSKVRISGKSDLEQESSYQGATKVMLSTTNTKKIHVRPNISLENKVYPETYYHHN